LKHFRDLQELDNVQAAFPTLELRDVRLWPIKPQRQIHLRQTLGFPGAHEHFQKAGIFGAEDGSGHGFLAHNPGKTNNRTQNGLSRKRFQNFLREILERAEKVSGTNGTELTVSFLLQ
jgi:hypothetical protein